jgi:hypothetical protein
MKGIYRVSQEEMSIFGEVTISAILSEKVYMYMCSFPNGFRDRAISLYIPKIVEKEEILHTTLHILHTVSNAGIYCSSDRVGTVYPV